MDKNSLTIDELVELILAPKYFACSKKIAAMIELYESTSFLPEKTKQTERALYVKFKQTSIAKCPVCKNPTTVETYTKDRFHVKCCSHECKIVHRKRVDPETGLTSFQAAGVKAKDTNSEIDPETGLNKYQKAAAKTHAKLAEIDPETGLTGHQKAALKMKATKSTVDLDTRQTQFQIAAAKTRAKLLEIDPDTGLSGYQAIGQKSKQTLSKTDPDTGLSGRQKAAAKTHAKLAEIDPETGLTGYQKAAAKTHAKLTEIDPETGLTGHQKAALKVKQTMSKIDPETGLSGYKTTAAKIHAKLGTIDTKTGLSGYQTAAKSTKNTLNKINPETGLTGFRERSIAVDKTLSHIDPETGLTGYQAIGIKVKATREKVDPTTGLSNYQKAGAKTKETMSKIDPSSGLSGYELVGLKSKQTLLGSDCETGLSGYQKLGAVQRTSNYKRIVEKATPDFKILTTEKEFSLRFPDSHNDARSITYKCTKCETVRTSSYVHIRCIKCNPYSISTQEKEVFDFCNQFTDDLEGSNRKIIKPFEIDIYSEKFKLAIEFNGVYWHSSDSTVNEMKEYHLEKTQLCEQRGVQLLHVFGNEWIVEQKQAIWKSIIRNKFGESNRIFARKCNIKTVDSKTARMFLENNHLQGSCPSSINYGLYYNNLLVSLMSFGKSRYNKKYKYELLRFCSIVDTSVTGGASRLFKHFIKNHEGSVISYADKRRSDGNLYKQLGFELSHETEPNYFYIDNKDQLLLHSRVKFQKHKLPELLEVFDKSKTESENMYNNGYRKIYDCGNYVFIHPGL